MYALLFRSRWFALGWVVIMAVNAVLFATTGAGALMTGTGSSASELAAARQSKFKAWVEDDADEDGGIELSRPDRARDGMARDEVSSDEVSHGEAARETTANAVPFSGSDSSNSDTNPSQ